MMVDGRDFSIYFPQNMDEGLFTHLSDNKVSSSSRPQSLPQQKQPPGSQPHPLRPTPSSTITMATVGLSSPGLSTAMKQQQHSHAAPNDPNKQGQVVPLSGSGTDSNLRRVRTEPVLTMEKYFERREREKLERERIEKERQRLSAEKIKAERPSLPQGHGHPPLGRSGGDTRSRTQQKTDHHPSMHKVDPHRQHTNIFEEMQGVKKSCESSSLTPGSGPVHEGRHQVEIGGHAREHGHGESQPSHSRQQHVSEHLSSTVQQARSDSKVVPAEAAARVSNERKRHSLERSTAYVKLEKLDPKLGSPLPDKPTPTFKSDSLLHNVTEVGNEGNVVMSLGDEESEFVPKAESPDTDGEIMIHVADLIQKQLESDTLCTPSAAADTAAAGQLTGVNDDMDISDLDEQDGRVNVGPSLKSPAKSRHMPSLSSPPGAKVRAMQEFSSVSGPLHSQSSVMPLQVGHNHPEHSIKDEAGSDSSEKHSLKIKIGLKRMSSGSSSHRQEREKLEKSERHRHRHEKHGDRHEKHRHHRHKHHHKERKSKTRSPSVQEEVDVREQAEKPDLKIKFNLKTMTASPSTPQELEPGEIEDDDDVQEVAPLESEYQASHSPNPMKLVLSKNRSGHYSSREHKKHHSSSSSHRHRSSSKDHSRSSRKRPHSPTGSVEPQPHSTSKIPRPGQTRMANHEGGASNGGRDSLSRGATVSSSSQRQRGLPGTPSQHDVLEMQSRLNQLIQMKSASLAKQSQPPLPGNESTPPPIPPPSQ